MRDLTFLTGEDISFIDKISEEYRLSFQDRRILGIIASDLRRWDEGVLQDIWKDTDDPLIKGRDRRKRAMDGLKARWEELKTRPKDYSGFSPGYRQGARKAGISDKPPETPIMGRCPVASERTRCCNLMTLDAVMGCGYDCSYCSIQTFYHTEEVLFHDDLKRKLIAVSAGLSSEKQYHIGTGQSSDSLMWGNRNGMLDDLFDFAEANPNVLLELKTKSANIDFLLERKIPANVLTTWSLNPQIIIENEEHLTAPLEKRLEAAERTARKGGLVGFHFHPIIIYKGWKEDYSLIFSRILNDFSAEDISHISFGTLTFIKPVIKELRKRKLKSKILQMPMEETAGKLSYPFEIKKEIFKFAYDAFEEWHDSVFFYLCMEDIRLWEPVFGRGYESNEQFESDMISSYFVKVNRRWNRR